MIRYGGLICSSHLGNPSSSGVDKDRRLLGLITRASNIEPRCFYLLSQPEILPFGRLYRRLYCKALNYSVAARIGRGGERLRGKRHYLWQQPLFLLLFHLAAHRFRWCLPEIKKKQRVLRAPSSPALNELRVLLADRRFAFYSTAAKWPSPVPCKTLSMCCAGVFC